MSKSKPVIEDVIISKDKLAEFKSSLKSRSQNKLRVIREYYGGVCTICAETPTKKVLYDLEGYGQRVEWYCDKCYQRWIKKEKREF